MTIDPTMSERGAPQAHHRWRIALQVLIASLVALPALLNASSGRGSYLGAALVFAVAQSAVWIVCAVGLSLGASAARTTQHSATPDPAGSVAEARQPGVTGGQPLARIPVARVPADQAVHADVDGHVTAATSTTGASR